LSHLERWQGEQGVITPVYGVYHPRRARWQILWDILLDQAGMPRERNTVWYDESHGFWAFPSWWMNGNKGLNPHALMIRVWAEEVYGHAYEERLSFGTGVGERMFTGNIYVSPTGTRRIGFLCTSHLDNATVTLQLAGTIPASVTWRTAMGVDNTIVPDADGRITLPVLAEPTWVRLPAGTTATVHTFLGLNNMNAPNLAGFNSNAVFEGVKGSRKVVDETWARTYGTTDVDQVTTPTNLSITFGRKILLSHAVIFSGMAWQGDAALLDFDIQTGERPAAGYPNIFPNPSFETDTNYAAIYNSTVTSLVTPTVVPHGQKVLQVDPAGPGASGAGGLSVMLYPIPVTVGQRVSVRMMMKLADNSPSSSLYVTMYLGLYNNGTGIGDVSGIIPGHPITALLTKTWQTIVVDNGTVTATGANQMGIQIIPADDVGKVWAATDRYEVDRVQVTDTPTAPDYEGFVWTTRATVTKAATSIQHGTSTEDTGCQRETYWDEQWVFPVELPTPVDCDAIRIVARGASYGGEPDAASLAVGGQGGTPNFTVSEVYVMGDTPPKVAGNP
jgi:hypothetical protein